MRTIAELCVRRPVFTWVLVMSLVVLGLSALTDMPIERFPNVEVPFVSVTVSAPGMSSEQVEAEVTTRLENALGTVGGLERLDSSSEEGQSVVWAQFVLEKDASDAANEVRDRINRLGDELPKVTRPPRVETFNANSAPIILVTVESEPSGARTALELSELADTVVRRELQAVRGVGSVKLIGGEARSLSIELDPLKLRAMGLTAQEVQRALERESLEVPGGSLAEGESTLGIRLAAKANTAEKLAQVVVARHGDLGIRLRDVARVVDGPRPSASRASISGEPAVVLAVTKQPGENTVAVADELRERVQRLAVRLPTSVKVRLVQDNSEDIRAAVHAVTEHLVLGSLFAAIVVLAFLRSWRATVITALAIPTSVMGALAAAHALGVGLNLLSLLGLTLAVGIVIDDAIVVLENIVRVLGQRRLDTREAAIEATREIALAVLATTLSLVAVFMPIASMHGKVGRYLAPFGLTMSVSILLSMAVAFTLTPMLCARWLKPETLVAHAEASHGSTGWFARFAALYGRNLEWALRHRGLVAIALVLTACSAVPIAAQLALTFAPVEDSARFTVYVRLPDRVSVERTAQIAELVAARVRGGEHIASTLVLTLNNREATVTVYLDQHGVQAETMERVRQEARSVAPPEALTMVGPTDDLNPPGPDSATIQYVIRGTDLLELEQIATRLLERVKKIPGTVDHGVTSASQKAEYVVRIDRDHASALGVSHAEVGRALALVDREGVELISARDPESKVELALKVQIRVAADDLAPEDLVRALLVRTQRGELLPLSSVATFSRAEGPGVIRRASRERQIKLFMNTLPGTSDAAVVRDVQSALREVDPSGRYRGDLLGDARDLEAATRALLFAVVLSFAFMYLILAAQFESWLHPVTILLSLPLTVPFGLLSLWLAGESLNIFSALGFLVLFGVVKKNSILQIDRILQLRAQGMPRHEAVLTACRDRLRPILMTTLAFVAGMLPLIASRGPGAATNHAVSVGILGGQSLSLLLTLIATPVTYVLFDDLAERARKRLRNTRTPASAEGPLSAAP